MAAWRGTRDTPTPQEILDQVFHTVDTEAALDALIVPESPLAALDAALHRQQERRATSPTSK